MPPSFLSSFAEKAQTAINNSPLAAHLPASVRTSRPGSPDSSAQPPANVAAAQAPAATNRSHALVDALQYQLRTFGQAYSSSTTPIQKIVTAQKGVAIDFDSVSRDAKSVSKELYTWGQAEDEDIKDVSDRLAYLNFVAGSLASSLSVKLDAARAPLKALRDAESALQPRRNIRAGLQLQLSRIEHDQQKGSEKKISELKDQIAKAEHDDGPQEKEIDILKRKGIKESEELKWEAIREYGEKLVLLAQASCPVVAALPSVPPTASAPYTGAQATGAARASLQRALDNYKTGHINLSHTTADLHRSDTRSFGETHASELSTMTSDPDHALQSGLPMTPPATHDHSTPPINPSSLNLSPAPIPAPPAHTGSSPPAGSSESVPTHSTAPVVSQATISTSTPTVAETGNPVAVSPTGPGPAMGSLHDVHAAPHTTAPRTSISQVAPSLPKEQQQFESAEAEKKRLAQQYSATSQPQNAGGPPPVSETAEDEKKRLERAERERVLQGSTTGADKKDGPDDLPPYQDY